jgi:hypothetical protein
MKQLAFAIAAVGLAGPAAAFEVKGYTPGMEISKVDLAACEKIANADSGVPGFRCDTTLGGDKAELRLLVFEGTVVGMVFKVPDGRMTPTLDALSQKYGRPVQPNRNLEEYNWRKGELEMTIKDNRVTRSYQLLLVDFELFRKAQAANADKAKKDI